MPLFSYVQPIFFLFPGRKEKMHAHPRSRRIKCQSNFHF